MVNNLFKKSVLICGLALATTQTVLGAGFTVGKGKYDFGIEYMGTFHDNKAGQSNKIYAQDIEINNEFGITENQSIAFDVFITRKDAMDTEFTNEESPSQYSFQTRYRNNFIISDSVNLGLQNAIGFFENSDGTYTARYELRGMIRHDTKQGLYKHSRAELSFRKKLNTDAPDEFRLDLRTKLRLAPKIDYLLFRLNLYAGFASQGYLNSNPTEATDGRINSYNLSTLKLNKVDFYTGPEFKFGKNNMIYIYYGMQLDASEKKRNHAKSFLIGFTKTFEE